MTETHGNKFHDFTTVIAEIVETRNPSSYTISGNESKVVVQPTHKEQIGLVLRQAHERNISVIPWGGGTQIGLGNNPSRLDVIMDLTSIDKVVTHNPSDLTATVQAGIPFKRLQDVLAKHNQFLPLDPPLPDVATLGGTLATANVGSLRWQNGSPRDVVIGMEVFQANGTSVKSGGQVVKNVSGYDMARLHIGGLGTLGIITEVSLKLTPLPHTQSTLILGFQDKKTCIAAALSIYHSDIIPLAICNFDRLVNDHSNATDIACSDLLAVRLGGRRLSMARQIQECSDIGKAFLATEIETLDSHQTEAIWRKLTDFGSIQDPSFGLGLRISVLPTQIPEVTNFLSQNHLSNTKQLHIVCYPTLGAIFVYCQTKNMADDQSEIIELLNLIKKGIANMGGSTIIDRCPQEIKRDIDTWDEVSDSIRIMRRLKEQYDPQGILNPGRFVGGI